VGAEGRGTLGERIMAGLRDGAGGASARQGGGTRGNNGSDYLDKVVSKRVVVIDDDHGALAGAHAELSLEGLSPRHKASLPRHGSSPHPRCERQKNFLME